MNINYYGKTDQGLVRAGNEDSLGLFPQLGLFMVADGMGGRPAGDVASRLVVEVLPLLIKQRIPELESLNNSEIIQVIKAILTDLSNRILYESRNRTEFEGMGTTLVMALITEQYRFIAHMGDSRAYIFREEVLQQITNDHNLVRHLLLSGELTQAEGNDHPGKNQLLQYIGMESDPNPTVICIPRMTDEYLLLCTDGLSNMLSHQEMTRILLQGMNSTTKYSESKLLEQWTNSFIDAGRQAGGEDNITVLLTN